ncbi:uncharacterized protein TNCV_1214711 [Trichonephila clavipes]|nr:uncharacterized protein TNCV_1214711 [Trichonephila clavipes]
MTWFNSAAVQFPRVQHHSKRKHRWVGVKGSTRNGRRDPKCPLARQLCMLREDTGAPSEGATCAWMAADEAVGYTPTRGRLVANLEILNHGQVTMTTPELARYILNTTSPHREDVRAVDRFNRHRSLTIESLPRDTIP